MYTGSRLAHFIDTPTWKLYRIKNHDMNNPYIHFWCRIQKKEETSCCALCLCHCFCRQQQQTEAACGTCHAAVMKNKNLKMWKSQVCFFSTRTSFLLSNFILFYFFSVKLWNSQKYVIPSGSGTRSATANCCRH